MKILVTGSAGHLGEALVRTIDGGSNQAVGIDILTSPFTTHVGSITDKPFVENCMRDVDAVIHSATLHKPHVATHSRQDFVDTNITGTLTLLEEAVRVGVKAFIFTSTTSTFGNALIPPPGEPAAWITEDVVPVPKNIYGVTKVAAENLCELFYRKQGLACLILRTSRFFPEEDDNRQQRAAFEDANAKANEFLFRRVDIEDIVSAHLLAVDRASEIGFDRYIISATTPFLHSDLADLRQDAARVVEMRIPGYAEVYARRGWRMFPSIDRVYVNQRARDALGWKPIYNFDHVIGQVRAGDRLGSELARQMGSKGYHGQAFDDGPYPVEGD